MQQEDQSMNNETSFDRGTILFDVNNEKSQRIDDIMRRIYTALVEKGYNPVNQIVGYVMSETRRTSLATVTRVCLFRR